MHWRICNDRNHWHRCFHSKWWYRRHSRLKTKLTKEVDMSWHLYKRKMSKWKLDKTLRWLTLQPLTLRLESMWPGHNLLPANKPSKIPSKSWNSLIARPRMLEGLSGLHKCLCLHRPLLMSLAWSHPIWYRTWRGCSWSAMVVRMVQSI